LSCWNVWITCFLGDKFGLRCAMVWMSPKMYVLKLNPHRGSIKRWDFLGMTKLQRLHPHEWIGTLWKVLRQLI
jgi:hypothetical protein